MFPNPFKAEEALPLRQRRIWRKPRCNANPASDAHFHAHIRASCAAHMGDNFNHTPSALFVVNLSAASTTSSI
jgi:hypothetical protein